MALAPLPHVYPFRFVDTVARERDESFSTGTVELIVSAGQRACSGSRWPMPLLLAEVIAQSALLLQGGDPAVGRGGFLAGISNFRAERGPEPGERLAVDVTLVARFGPTVKFRGVVRSRGEELASGEILVRHGEAA